MSRRPLKNAFQLLSASVAVKFIGIAMIGFCTRYLTKEELALLPIYDMIGALAPIFLSFGITPTLMKYLPGLLERDPESARGLVRSSVMIMSMGSVVFGIGVYLLADQIGPRLLESETATQLIRIAAPGFIFLSGRNMTQYLLWAMSRFDKLSIIRVFSAIGRAVLCISFLLAWGLEGLVWGLVLNDALCLLLSVIYLRDMLSWGPGKGWGVKKLITVSSPFYFESFLMYFRNQGDNWIVATLLGPGAISVYFIAKRFPQTLTMALDSLDKVITTEISRREHDPTEISRYIRRLDTVLSFTALPAILLIIGSLPHLITLIAGSEYTDAVVPAMLLCGMQLVRVFNLTIGRGVFVIKPPKFRVMLTTIESVILILCLVVLTPLMAERGVATSRLFSALVGWAATYVLLRRSIGPTFPVGQTLSALVAGGGMTAVMLVLHSLQPHLVWAPVHAIAGVGLFLAIISILNTDGFYGTLGDVLPSRVRRPWRRSSTD